MKFLTYTHCEGRICHEVEIQLLPSLVDLSRRGKGQLDRAQGSNNISCLLETALYRALKSLEILIIIIYCFTYIKYT